MTYDADWPLRFVVDEKINFPLEYPLKELVTLSLEPLVDVDEKESYVCIRGELELRGEYKTGEPVQGRESSNQYFPVNMVHVYRGEDDFAEFSYSFPIDVTIPIARVNNQEDIQVCVDLFDYELTKEGTLLLHTDLTILGVRGETIRTEDSLDVEEELTPFPAFYEIPVEDDLLPPVPSRSEQNQVVEIQPAESAEQNHDHLEMNESMDFEMDLTVEHKEEESSSSGNESVEMVQEEKNKSKKDPTKKKGSLSLTEFFNRYEEVPAVKWKMCIVQKQDSLEDLSIKYNVPVQHLARVNHLDPTKDLQMGQSLYIPQ